MFASAKSVCRIALAGLGAAGCGGESLAANTTASVTIDVAAERRPISFLIYGVNWASTQQLEDLNSPLNRQGGNATSRYNWRINASNRGRDWYFESTGERDPTPGELGDTFIRDSRAAGAEPMLTIPMLDWVAKLGPDRTKLSSFSIAKYGAQGGADAEWFPDAGNGIRPDGSLIAGNDPNDAHIRVDSSYQQAWVQHLVSTWGSASCCGLRYYILDNEPSIWHSTHRDVHPAGATMEEMRRRIIDYASKIKDVDSGALVVAPEEWGWTGYFRSGYDKQWGDRYGWAGTLPDRFAHDNWAYLPWLLAQLQQEHERTGTRLLDIFSVHFYPQGGESSDDMSIEKQLLRNRSTRSLWDPSYLDESWIDDYVALIPRLRSWVRSYYPGTAIAITEYDWGAEQHMSGAVAQADVLGIFGREGLDMAARWEAPAVGTPVYNAMKLYRNYDGNKSTFGDVSVRATVRNPDELAAFAALRSRDGALTAILINKSISDSTDVKLDLANFTHAGTAQRWELGAAKIIARLSNALSQGNRYSLRLPPQSITLLVIQRVPAP
jgi:Glycoside hydrolase family 44